MKNWIRFTCCLLLFISPGLSSVQAQDLTGIWRGHFRGNDGLERLAGSNYDDRYKIEVQIAQTHNRLDAVTFSYKSTEFYGKANASGSFNIQSKKVLLKENKLLEVRFASGTVYLMTCLMQYSKLGNDEYLQGTYYSTDINDSTSNRGKGSIFLHRVTASDFQKEPFLEEKEKELMARKKPGGTTHKKSEPLIAVVPPKQAEIIPKSPAPKKVLSAPKVSSPIASIPKVSPPVASAKPVAKETPAVNASHKQDSVAVVSKPAVVKIPVPAVLMNRTNSLLKTITVNSNVIELRIYDDGAIDNDTVSVYYDNKLIISHGRLSDEPIIAHITVESSASPHELVMVAENLGDIPPNTSLLVVQDGEKKYEERIISTEQKNVQINFVYKKIE